MVYQTIVYTKRKAGVTPQEYKDQLENKHLPVFREIAGDAFPISHKRHYLTVDEAGKTATLLGSSDLATFDGMAVALYEDKAHFERLMAILKAPENLERLNESGSAVDGPATFMVEVGDVCETKK